MIMEKAHEAAEIARMMIRPPTCKGVLYSSSDMGSPEPHVERFVMEEECEREDIPGTGAKGETVGGPTSPGEAKSSAGHTDNVEQTDLIRRKQMSL